MEKFKSEELINQLAADVQKIIAAAEHLRQADPVKLSYPPEDGKWSVAQVLEHVNSYNRYYLPAIEKAMVHVSKDLNAWFVPGFWGNYFTKMIRPKNVFEVTNKMKASKNYRPTRGINVDAVFTEFLEQQQKLLRLLDTARKRNLNTIYIALPSTGLIKLKLGDALRYVVAHEQRHMIQARNAVKAVGVATDRFPVILEAAQL